jgi:DNA-binding response OmpR family regulator
MSKINLVILGSDKFLDILNELDLNYNITNIFNSSKTEKDNLFKVLFVDSLKIRDIKSYLSKNLPLILFLKNKDFIKENKLTLQNFHVPLTLPVEILSFVEILNILNTKFIFFNNSKIIINNYEIDSNTKIIMKNSIKVKLTEKELELIFALNKNNGLDKTYLLKNVWKHTSDLDSHAFETNLHRLRKKMYSSFKDKSFITEKKSLYYLSS